MVQHFQRWVVDEDGSNLVEYALLAAAIGLAGYAAINAMGNTMNATYLSWDDAIQSDALVLVPDPE